MNERNSTKDDSYTNMHPLKRVFERQVPSSNIFFLATGKNKVKSDAKRKYSLHIYLFSLFLLIYLTSLPW